MANSVNKELTATQRRALRAKAHPLHPVVLIGDKGLTESVLREIDVHLRSHELIKIRAQSERDEREAWLLEICRRLSAQPVQHIGKTLVIYRERPPEHLRAFGYGVWMVANLHLAVFHLRLQRLPFLGLLQNGRKRNAALQAHHVGCGCADLARQELLPDRDLRHPYLVVPRRDIMALFSKTGGNWPEFYRRYPDSGGYVEVSAVGFDRAKTRAMVYMAHHCGGLCGGGTHHLLEKVDGAWVTHGWIQEAIALYFRMRVSTTMEVGPFEFHDKIPLKRGLAQAGVRVVPPGTVRYGAFLERTAIVMPGYVNIGAYVGAGTMVDTWATVGSCAQIGKNVHLSGGAGIGGVLEPLQANPVIIEDNCFIGARAEVAEGVIVGEGSVLSMGVYLGASTRIVDRETGAITQGEVPAYSVVVPGTLPGKSGGPGLYCAVIVKRVDERTRSKTSINELLRD